MHPLRYLCLPFVLCALLGAAQAHAGKKTVCTITVNSADEWETFRARLPKGDYEFVELIDKGRPDWLRSSCSRGVQCDVLVVSGHFNAGDTFYSDRLERDEHLRVDELERASCSGSCPGIFARLKEVYLFGCESLNPDASKYASSYGESGRERMRRIFAGVPSIYGFSASAPVGKTAGMLIHRYFDGGGGPIGSGRPNTRLLSVFARNSMVRTGGVGDERDGARERVCRFYDERLTPAHRLRMIHAMMKRDLAQARDSFARIEAVMASVPDAERRERAFVQALAEISADEAVRDGYLAMARREPPANTRARMISLAAQLGWLSPGEERDERVALATELLARPAMGFAEVDLACALNETGELDGRVAGPPVPSVPQAAALACLGDAGARSLTLRALASADERDVQAVQAYLRRRPIADTGELREVARVVAHMPAGPAKVRALDALGRLHIADAEVLAELVRSFARATTTAIQRAIAEVFIRSDTKAIARPDVVAILQKHRLPPAGGSDELIEAVIRRLQTG